MISGNGNIVTHTKKCKTCAVLIDAGIDVMDNLKCLKEITRCDLNGINNLLLICKKIIKNTDPERDVSAFAKFILKEYMDIAKKYPDIGIIDPDSICPKCNGEMKLEDNGTMQQQWSCTHCIYSEDTGIIVKGNSKCPSCGDSLEKIKGNAFGTLNRFSIPTETDYWYCKTCYYRVEIDED